MSSKLTELDKTPPLALAEIIQANQRTPFVGRLDILVKLKNFFFDSLEKRQLNFITLIGEPGIGKSRLAQEFCRAVRTTVPEARVLSANATPTSGYSHAAVVRILHERFGLNETENPRQARLKLETTVRELLPDQLVQEVSHLLAHLLRIPYSASPIIEPLAQVPGQLELRTYIAVKRFLEKDAQKSPLLIHFDAVEDASAETANFIHYLADGLKKYPIFILATAQPDLFDRHHHWGEGEFAHFLSDLAPLPGYESEALFNELLHHCKIPSEVVKITRDQLSGNPRAIEEFARYLTEAGVVTVTPQGWQVATDKLKQITLPNSYAEILRARIDALPPNVMDVLQKAAAVGETFWVETVVALSRATASTPLSTDGPTLNEIASVGEKGSAQIIQALSELFAKGLVTSCKQSSMAGQREYHFPDHYVWELAYNHIAPDVQKQYHRLIAEWLELQPDGRREAQQERAGRHLELVGDKIGAATRYRRAADAARSRYANHKAIRLYQQALDCVNELEIAWRIHIWHDLGNIHQLKGDFERALDAFERMLRLSWMMASRSKVAVAFNKMGRVWRQQGNLTLALDYLERGLELFRQSSDKRGVATSLDDIGQVLLIMGRLEEAFERSSKALEMRRRLGDNKSIAVPLSNIGNIERKRGHFAEAERCYREAMELRQVAGDRYGSLTSLTDLGELFFERGELDAARENMEKALQEAEQIGALPLRITILNRLSEIALKQNKIKEARPNVELALSLSQELEDQRVLVEILRNQSLVELHDGNHVRAEKIAQECLELSQKRGLREMVGRALMTMGEIHAVTIFDETRERSHVSAKAIDYFKQAISLFREIGCEADLGHALKRLGEYLLEYGKTVECKTTLQEALDIFERLKMPLADQIRDMFTTIN